MSRFEFKMPKLGESITEATIITWFKNVGDIIEQDEMLLEVATDKVDSEVPSTVTGIIEDILYHANDVIKVGDPIAVIKIDGSVVLPKQKKDVASSVVEKSQKKKSDDPKTVKKLFQNN